LSRRSSSPSRDDLADHSQEFDDFFRSHYRELGRLAYTLTGNRDDADDVTGEALAAAWERWDTVRAADHPLAYARRIVVNLAADRVRRMIRERQRSSLLAPITRWIHHGPDVGAAVDLQAAILALSPGRRECVVLRYVFDLSEREVAATLGISAGTVKSQTFKGLRQLRQILSDAPDHPWTARAEGIQDAGPGGQESVGASREDGSLG
jgi:RNA polymerase sigma-70 factor (sigma-E family)